jgi:hypothetical protein
VYRVDSEKASSPHGAYLGTQCDDIMPTKTLRNNSGISRRSRMFLQAFRGKT